MGETFGNDVTQIVGLHKKDDDSKLKDRQFPLAVDDKFHVVIELSNVVTKNCDTYEINKKQFDIFMKKYGGFEKDELVKAVTIGTNSVLEKLQESVACVGCRREVEELIHRAESFDHSLYESLDINENGFLSISASFYQNPKRMFRLLFFIRPKLYEVLDSVLKGKKNKRCIFHSLKMMKPNEYHPTENKYSIQKSFGSSVIDVWDQMCQECHNEITRLECNGIVETMDFYLKKHRFCSECKSKVQRAYHMLTGDVDHQNEPGFCSAIFDGLKFCKNSTGTGKVNKAEQEPNHVHVCCERAYIVHMLSQADAEISGGRKEKHAKTIDIAQEEVCTCLSLYLYYRLHKVWHSKLTFEQTWFILLLISLELIQQKFETSVESKFGYGRMEAFCKELEKDEEMKNLKIQKKRMKRKNKQKKKREQKTEKCVSDTNDNMEDYCGAVQLHDCALQDSNGSSLNFPNSLLDMLKQKTCDCSHDSLSNDLDLTKDEILEFEKNRSEIESQRVKLRDHLKQKFNDYVVASIQQNKDAE